MKQIYGLILDRGRCGQQLIDLLDNQMLHQRVALRREDIKRRN